jgi:two-component system invasion response regulator UvrY
MIRIIVCDDHPIVREGIRLIVQRHKDIAPAEQAASGGELLAKLQGSQFDVILLDVSLPGEPDGIDLLKRLKRDHPDLAVLVMSMYPERQLGVRALKAGASGYLVKGSPPAEIIAAIRKVASGGKYITAVLAEELAAEAASPREGASPGRLSDREHEVLRLIAGGKGISEIAAQLAISPATVGTYRSRLLAKLRLGSTAELVRYALEHGLLD